MKFCQRFSVSAFSLVLFAFLRIPVTAQQTAPKLLPFQGRLTDPNGVAVTNGTRFVQFKIYSVPTGGGPVWAGEVHKATVNGGLVNVLLGSKTPFIGVDFDKTLYLEITADINGDNAITAADPPMLPRQVILPAVFAKESADSRLLAGRDWTPIFGTNSPDGPLPATKFAARSITGLQIADETITASQIGRGTVVTSNLAVNAVSTDRIQDDAVTLAKLAKAIRDTLVPPGTISAFGGNTNRIPDGWLLCDGNSKSSVVYPGLFYAISTNWGAGTLAVGGTNDFNLPDLRGYFLRGVDGGLGRDPDNAARTNSAGAVVGNLVGSLQNDDYKSHTHQVAPGRADSGSGGSKLPYNLANGEWNTGPAGGNETRPKNAYINYIIKY